MVWGCGHVTKKLEAEKTQRQVQERTDDAIEKALKLGGAFVWDRGKETPMPMPLL